MLSKTSRARPDAVSPTHAAMASSRRALWLGVLAAVVVAVSPAVGLGQVSTEIEEAAALSVVAAAKAKSGEYKLCGDLFVQAYRLDPSYLGYLYSAARCSQKSGDLNGAEQGYRAFLARAPTEAPLRSRATGHLAEIVKLRESQPSPTETGKAKSGKGEAGKGEADKGDPGSGGSSGNAGGKTTGTDAPNPLLPPPKPMPTMTKLGWGSLVSGGVLVGVGAAVLMAGAADRDALVADLEPDPQSTLIDNMTHDQAVERAAAVDRSSLVGFTLSGVGIIAAAAGAILLLSDTSTDEPSAALLPAANGFALRVRW
jgi:hypothetical protein